MRKLTDPEVPLVKKLIELADRRENPRELAVSPLDDGGMGSLRIGSPSTDRRLGGCVAEVQFKDEDGTVVCASLNVDETQDLFELDVWKTDFSPLKRWPSEKELEVVPNAHSQTNVQ